MGYRKVLSCCSCCGVGGDSDSCGCNGDDCDDGDCDGGDGGGHSDHCSSLNQGPCSPLLVKYKTYPPPHVLGSTLFYDLEPEAHAE